MKHTGRLTERRKPHPNQRSDTMIARTQKIGISAKQKIAEYNRALKPLGKSARNDLIAELAAFTATESIKAGLWEE